MKCQILLSRKNKKNIISLSSAETETIKLLLGNATASDIIHVDVSEQRLFTW